MVEVKVQEQAAIVSILARLYENDLIKDESGAERLFTLGGMDRKLRETLYTAASQIAKNRGDNPRFAWIMPYSNESMERVTAYLGNVLDQKAAMDLIPNAPSQVFAEAPGTRFREMVRRQAGSPPNTSLPFSRN